MSFRREAFGLAGGFASAIGGIRGQRLHGEEVELSLRIRKKTQKRMLFVPEIKVWHKVYKHRFALRFVARSSYWLGYTKCVLKRLHRDEEEESDLHSVEHELLRRILIRLLPSIAKHFFTNPINSCREFSLTVTALFSVVAGYIMGGQGAKKMIEAIK